MGDALGTEVVDSNVVFPRANWASLFVSATTLPFPVHRV